VKLENEAAGITWKVSFGAPRVDSYWQQGWFRFSHDNNLKPGDVVVFILVGNSHFRFTSFDECGNIVVTSSHTGTLPTPGTWLLYQLTSIRNVFIIYLFSTKKVFCLYSQRFLLLISIGCYEFLSQICRKVLLTTQPQSRKKIALGARPRATRSRIYILGREQDCATWGRIWRSILTLERVEITFMQVLTENSFQQYNCQVAWFSLFL